MLDEVVYGSGAILTQYTEWHSLTLRADVISDYVRQQSKAWLGRFKRAVFDQVDASLRVSRVSTGSHTT
jgi:hypothetical protein